MTNLDKLWNSKHDIYETDLTDREWHWTSFRILCNVSICILAVSFVVGRLWVALYLYFAFLYLCTYVTFLSVLFFSFIWMCDSVFLFIFSSWSGKNIIKTTSVIIQMLLLTSFTIINIFCQVHKTANSGDLCLLPRERFQTWQDGDADLRSGGRWTWWSSPLQWSSPPPLSSSSTWPPLSSTSSITQEDRPRGNRSGLYEFFRGKAWVCGHALVGMAKVL